MRIGLMLGITAAVLAALMAAMKAPGVPATDPKMSFQVQLEVPAGVPLEGWRFEVVPQGTTRQAAQVVTSNATGLLTFDIPFNHFRPAPAPQAVTFRRALGEGSEPSNRKFAEFFLDREIVGRLNGPFSTTETNSRTLPLVAGAVATGTVQATGARDSLFFLYQDPLDSTAVKEWDGKVGAQRVGGLPRQAGVSMLVSSWSSSRLITVDLSAGTGDWGAIDVPASAGSSKLRLQLLNVPADRKAATATIVSVSTGVSYVSANSDKSGILKGSPGDASGVSLPPGEYLIFVGSIQRTEELAALMRLRDGLPFDSTKIPHVTLIDGQTMDLQLSFTEWWPKRLEIIPESPERIAKRLGTPPALPALYYPPGFREPVLSSNP